MITTTDPRTRVSVPTEIGLTSEIEVAELVRLAEAAHAPLIELGRAGRARVMDAIADSLDAQRSVLVAVAVSETGLSNLRLDGELSRSIFQFRLFGEVLREGSYLEATIDHRGESALGAVPDIRRLLLPIGPVAVFGSSNFPFAFSVAGGDTASALAAGCPVVLKAHSSHPLTSFHSGEALRAGIRAAGGPEDAVNLVYGQAGAAVLVAHPRIRAVGFTGSIGGARALQAIVDKRDEPIPFYGELSSINPFVITHSAAETRGTTIAEGLFASYTGSGGQFCTKPGIALVPYGAAGDRVIRTLSNLTADAGGAVLLNERIYSTFGEISERILTSRGLSLAARGAVAATDDGFAVPPMLLSAAAADVDGAIAEECFGPLLIAIRYSTLDDIKGVIDLLPASLTATIHSEDDDADLALELSRAFIAKSGRIIYDGYPTGVRVSWGQHHGGPWPATNSLHTSVGATSIRRFLRPFAWQDAPEEVLPVELRDGETTLPRRVDGKLQLPVGYTP